MTSRLPSDVVFAILLRLPIKSLCRFRYVSRSFLHRLNDPRFVKMHLTQPQKTKLILLYNSSLYSLDTEKLSYAVDENIAAMELVFPPCEGKFDIKESCNGLLLIEQNETFLVCNPSTRASKRIPELTPTNAGQIYGFGYRKSNDDYKFEIYGFGYAKSSDFYKFVKVSFSPTCEVCVFNLRTDSWRSAPNDLPPIASLLQSHGGGVFLNGAIHWGFKEGIGAFDLDEEKCKILPHPAALENIANYEDYTVGVVGDCLCVFFKNQDKKYELFIMKEYGVKESWHRIYIDLPGSYTLYRPLSLWKKDPGILFFGVDLWLGYFTIICYQEDGKFEEINIDYASQRNQITNMNVYVENMVSPNYHRCEFCCMEDID